MTKKQIEAHEKRFRKGNYQGFGWRDNFEAMAAKTVLRRLLGKWGVLSIDYQQASPATIAAADAIATGQFDDEMEFPEAAEVIDVDPETGEITEAD